MNGIKGYLGKRPIIKDILLPSLAVLFGLQLLRLFIPGMTWILGDRFGFGAFELGGFALLVFALTFLVPVFRKLLCSYKALIFSAGGLAILRALAQIDFGDPLVAFIFSALGSAFFGLFLVFYLDSARTRGYKVMSAFGIGILLGLAFDTALHGVFNTYDMVHLSGILPLAITIFIAIVIFLLLSLHNPISVEPIATKSTLPWLFIGPFLFLELVIFQSISRFSVLSGFDLPLSFLLVLASQLAGLFAAVWLLSKRGSHLLIITITSGIALTAVILISEAEGTLASTLVILCGQVSLSLLMMSVICGISVNMPERSFKSSFISGGFSMILFVIFILAYYAVYQVSLPYENTILEVISAVLTVTLTLAALRGILPNTKPLIRAYVTPVLALVLLIFPLISFAGWDKAGAASADTGNVKVMTYNLHNGFNTDGKLDMETLALVIEESGADVVALQEVSRGWLISGRLDMLSWLSERLDMPYVSGPTADPFWGNAIISKYPITEYRTYALPTDDLCIKRGFTKVLIDLGETSLQIIANHFHHIEGDSEIRQQQALVMLNSWADAPYTIILGDFNAEPDSPEMKMFEERGLVDSLSGKADILTFNSAELFQRIDYIWLTPDINLRSVNVPFSNASDHLGIVADIIIK